MKVGDVIRIPNGAVQAFELDSDIGMVVDLIPLEDHYPSDWEILVDGALHHMGFQLSETEVISEVA